MEKPGLEIIKDTIVSLLIVACIAIILSIVFYDDISIGKVIPEAEDYVLSTEMQKELEDSQLDNAEEIIVNYYIDASDLKKYEKTNEYDKGKSNPFGSAEISDSTDNIVDGENNSSSGNDSNSESGNFYEDEGIK